EYGLRMPSMRILVNTSAPQGSTGITTDLFPAMTLGCGALAGNITGDNIGPKHLFNIKRLARALRRPEEAWEMSSGSPDVTIDREEIKGAVERYLGKRGLSTGPTQTVATQVVDRFLAGRGVPQPVPASVPAAPETAPAEVVAPAPPIADFVCEDDVRQAIRESRKIYIRPKTIVTPSARDLATASDILVMAER
ncbi:MAG: hypothetical protein M3Z85_19075, partial [Acidobacteriota bacterium]|nr:hypothetical protein [Acidobacteriota bacterium]